MSIVTSKLIVGYTCRMLPQDLIADLVPPIKGDSRLKDPAKCKTPEEKEEAEKAIAEDLAKRKAAFEAESKYIPYLGTFNRVVIYDLKNKRTGRWNAAECKPFGSKAPMSERIVAWLLKSYPKAWGSTIDDGNKQPEVRFLGFDMRDFLKLLGVEATMPNSENVPPPRLWYANSDHREIYDAVAPDKAGKLLDFRKVVALRAPTVTADRKLWDEKFNKWTAPHADADLDAWLCMELAAQLGFLQE